MSLNFYWNLKNTHFFSDADYNEDAFSTLWFFWIMHNDIILFKCIFVIEVAVVLFFLKKNSGSNNLIPKPVLLHITMWSFCTVILEFNTFFQYDFIWINYCKYYLLNENSVNLNKSMFLYEFFWHCPCYYLSKST